MSSEYSFMIAPSVNEVPCFGICSVIIAFALHVNEHLNPCSSSNFFASEAVLFRTSCKVIFLIVDVFEFDVVVLFVVDESFEGIPK